MAESQWPTEDDVLSALDAAGRLLEQQVASELDALGYEVHTNQTYVNLEDDEPRELDVHAYKPLLDVSELRLHMATHLLIECAKADSPLAFLTRPLPPLPRTPEEVLITFHSQNAGNLKNGLPLPRRVPTFTVLGFDQLYWGTASPVKAVHISRLDRNSDGWQASDAGIFESTVLPMANTLRAFQAPYRDTRGAFDRRYDDVYVLFFIPIVVVASRLYVVDGTSTQPTVTGAAHVRLQRELQSDSLSGVFGIDFVERESLTTFVRDTVDRFAQQAAEIVAADPEALVPPHRWPTRPRS